jgi:hypothetical protein
LGNDTVRTVEAELAATGASVESRGWVAAVASERCASLGDTASCQRLLDASRIVLTRPADETPVLGIGAFTIDERAAYAGGDLVRMGRYRDAEPAFDAAIDNLGPYMQRHRCIALIDRAEGRLGAGEVDGACQDGQAVLDLVTQVQHAGNFRRIHALAKQAHEAGCTAGRDLWHNVLATTAHPNGHA